MGWTLSGKPRVAPATQALAIKYRDMEAVPQDRPFSERRLMVYRRAMKAGDFRTPQWATCYCRETGVTYRINGKHTSTMLAELEDIPDFYVNLEHFEADTLQDVSRLYATYDSKLMSRTTADINRSFAATIAEFSDIPNRTVNLAVTGLSFARWQERYGAIPAPERAELMLEHSDFVVWLNDILSGGEDYQSSRHLDRGPVAGAMFLSWQKSQKAATEFWSAVRDETGPVPSCPDRKLARFLRDNRVNIGSGSRTPANRRASQREFFVKSIHAWNAFRKNKPISGDLKYFSSAKVPSVV